MYACKYARVHRMCQKSSSLCTWMSFVVFLLFITQSSQPGCLQLCKYTSCVDISVQGMIESGPWIVAGSVPVGFLVSKTTLFVLRVLYVTAMQFPCLCLSRGLLMSAKGLPGFGLSIVSLSLQLVILEWSVPMLDKPMRVAHVFQCGPGGGVICPRVCFELPFSPLHRSLSVPLGILVFLNMGTVFAENSEAAAHVTIELSSRDPCFFDMECLLWTDESELQALLGLTT